MWVKQCHKPPLEMVTIPPVKMVMTGGWFIIKHPPKRNHGGCREFPHFIGTMQLGCLILGDVSKAKVNHLYSDGF